MKENRNDLRVIIAFALLLLLHSAAFQAPAQTKSPAETGKIIKVVAESDAEQSYALYLPTAYSPEKKWAILYCFDPAGRGDIPAEIFREAAEKYGYILVGSNNSKNGLGGAAMVKALTVFWNDTHKRLSIDPHRVYATGFSGGARVAARFAVGICADCVAGVIGVGAGFPADLPPSAAAQASLIYFGITGSDDFNYPEMRSLENALDQAGVANRVESFPGGHQWLPKAFSIEALEWLDLRAMKSGKLEKSDSFIDSTFNSRIALTESAGATGGVLDRFRRLSEIAEDFEGLRDVSKIRLEALQLKDSPELKNGLRAEKEQFTRQQKLAAEFMQKVRNYVFAGADGDRQTPLREFRLRAEEVKKDAEAKDDGAKRRVARRALGQVFAEMYQEAVFRHEREKRYDTAAAVFELLAIISPKSPSVWFNLARFYALDGQKKGAISALEKAVGSGYRNSREIKSEESFTILKSEEKFRRLLEKVDAANAGTGNP